MWGDILSTMGDVQYCGGIMSIIRGGGYLEYRGDTQYHGDVMMHVGDIMNTVRVFSTMGGKFFVD